MRVTFCVSAALAALLAGCAVGPDFKKPAAPEVGAYTPAALTTTSGTTNVTGGEPQRFVSGGDIPGEWWTLFHSQPLSDLIELSLSNNPTLKAAQAALQVGRENVLAQKGSYYPASQEASRRPARRPRRTYRPHPTPGLCISTFIPLKSACPMCRTSLVSTAGRSSP